jgi:CheY-like chemotaxis protein
MPGMEPERKHPPRVLLIEDDPGHQRLLEIYIKRLGCQCECCFDGQVGLEKATDNEYDLILADIHIPELDGFILAVKMREMGIRTPMIAVTALKLDGIERKALAVGYNAFLSKPINQEALADLVRRYIRPDSVESRSSG